MKRGQAYYGKGWEWREGPDNELTRKEKEVMATVIKEGLEQRLKPIDIERGRLVDVGGGFGEITSKVAPLFSEIVVIEQDSLKIPELKDRSKNIPYLSVWEGNFMQYEPIKRFDVALFAYVLFSMRHYNKEDMLRKAIKIVNPGGWVVFVSNSITSREGNQVHFRKYMGAHKDIKYPVGEMLRRLCPNVEVERVEIKHKKQSGDEMVELIKLVLPKEDRYRTQRIIAYAERYLKKQDGYLFSVDQDILWGRVKQTK